MTDGLSAHLGDAADIGVCGGVRIKVLDKQKSTTESRLQAFMYSCENRSIKDHEIEVMRSRGQGS